MDEPMIFAAVGLGFLVVSLAFLAIYQQQRGKSAANAKIEQLRSNKAADDDRPPGSTPFFVGCFRGYNPRFFRVYLDAGRLLFLRAGPCFVLIDADAARGESRQHWLVRSWTLLAITLVSGAVAGGLIFAAVANAISSDAAGLWGGGHFMVVILGIACLLALVTVIFVPSVLWQLDRRGKELDALPLSELRKLAEVEDRSFAAGWDNVPDVMFSLVGSAENLRTRDEIGAVINFTHAATGKWAVETLMTRDTRTAIEMAYAVWGKPKVRVDQTLIDHLARTVDAGQLEIASLAAGLQPLVAKAQPRVVEEDQRRAAAAAAEQERRAIAPKIGDPGSTFSMNGVGTMVCDGRGIVEWDYWIGDSDALLAFCFLGLPIVPYKAVHVYEWNPGVDVGFEHRSHPIRWTWGLTASAYTRRVWGVLVVVGVLMVMGSYFGEVDLLGTLLALPPDDAKLQWLDDMRIRVLFGALGVLAAIGGIVARWMVERAETRHRAIRRLLGRHVLGSCDPVFWPRDLLATVGTPQQTMESPSYAEAVDQAMQKRDYRQAMFAARLSTALEDRHRGEELTNAILQEETVQQIVREIHNKPKEYGPLMRSSVWNPADLFDTYDDSSSSIAS